MTERDSGRANHFARRSQQGPQRGSDRHRLPPQVQALPQWSGANTLCSKTKSKEWTRRNWLKGKMKVPSERTLEAGADCLSRWHVSRLPKTRLPKWISNLLRICYSLTSHSLIPLFPANTFWDISSPFLWYPAIFDSFQSKSVPIGRRNILYPIRNC